MTRKYTGLNIQYPVTDAIFDGSKPIETRTYPLPKNLEYKKLVVIETPGKVGKFKARCIGFVAFGPSVKYKNKEKFYIDAYRHGVWPDNKQFKWDAKKGKHGWPVLYVSRFREPLPAPKKGIVYAKDVNVEKAVELSINMRNDFMMHSLLTCCQETKGMCYELIGLNEDRRDTLLAWIKDKAASNAMLVTPVIEDNYTKLWTIGNNTVYVRTLESVISRGAGPKSARYFMDASVGGELR